MIKVILDGEEEKTEETPTETPATDLLDGEEVKEEEKVVEKPNVEANDLIERLETATKKNEEILLELKKAEAQRALDGTSEAGATKPEEVDPLEDPIAFANAFRNGNSSLLTKDLTKKKTV